MSVGLKTGPTLDPGLPQPLFQTTVRVDPILNQYAVTADGRRFLTLESTEQSAPPMTLLVNWTAALGR